MSVVAEPVQDRIGRAYVLLGQGQLQDAQRLLQRATPEASTQDPLVEGAAAQALAIACALRGYSEEAQEALARARTAVSARSEELRNEILRAFLFWIEGDSLAVIDTCAGVLATPGISAEERNQTLALLAGAYLQLGFWERALDSIRAISQAGVCATNLGWLGGQLILGDLYLWRALRRALQLPEGSNGSRCREQRRESIQRLCLESERAYQEVLQSPDAPELFKRLAAAGQCAAKALACPPRSSPLALEAHLDWLNRAGLTCLHRAFRWTMGLLLLVEGNRPMARAWLVPLCSEALGGNVPLHEIEWVVSTAQLLEAAGFPIGGDMQSLKMLGSAHQNRIGEARKAVTEIDFAGVLAGRRVRRSVRGSELIERVERHVRETLNKPQSISDLASATGVSRRKLELSFRAATGQSPKQFITALRLIEAQRIMKQQGMHSPASLRKIATETGFASYRRFAASFVATFGVSPFDALQASRDRLLVP